LLAIALGRPLIGLNYVQLDKEANFRAGLVHVGQNAESIVLFRREGRLRVRLLHRLEELTANFRRIIAVNRNLGFFTTGYNYLIQIIPTLIVAPLYIRGEIEFGVITQSAMAFAQLLGAFSLIVTQFQSISSFAAVVARVGSLMEAMDKVQSARLSAIEVRKDAGRIAFERLTLWSPEDDRPLIKELSVSVPGRTRLLIGGPNHPAKIALFRATAGIWDKGEGCIVHPAAGQIMFLPEHPYLPQGTLRESLLEPREEHSISHDRILSTLQALDLEPLVTRASGLDVEQNWSNLASLGEQQLLAIARVLLAAPQFVFLDRIDTTLSHTLVARVLEMLSEKSITDVTFAEAVDRLDEYDAVLELAGDGGWAWKPIRAGRIVQSGTVQ
jgi:putative ATP-binding cassette transporter